MAAWQEGFDAFRKRKPQDENPYFYGSDDWDSWHQGYESALRKLLGDD